MCGRFFLEIDADELIKRYGVHEAPLEETSSGEIYPTNYLPVIINDGSKKVIKCKWEYPVKSLNKKLINARIETISERPMFKQSFYSRRCLIPANSFFEWRQEDKKKTKYNISVNDEPLFSMAGIYNVFEDSKGIYYGFVIITREANDTMKSIHSRMPLIIAPDFEDLWLDNKIKSKNEFSTLINCLLNQSLDLNLKNDSIRPSYEQLSF